MNFGKLKTSSGPLWLVLCLLPVLLAADLPEEAAKKLREGLQYFRDSQFAEAETAFAEASEIAPESDIIIFDEACAARINNDVEQARRLFLKAAQSHDSDLSVKSHYNLGCLEADVAREKLGDDPGAAEGDVRTESIDLLLTAVRHYRDVLRFQPQHPDARHNLELIRLFIKHIQSEWAKRDKQKARDEKDLLQFLKMIEDRETELRGVTRMLSTEDRSASQRKLLRETGDSQSALQEEIEPLKQKITEQIQQSQQQAGSSGAAATPATDQTQAEQLLHELADLAGTGMLQAATSIAAADFDAAEVAQNETLEHLNQLYMAIAPYQDILQKSIQQQTPLVPADVVEDEASDEEDAIGEAVEEPGQPTEPVADAPEATQAPREIDFSAVQETQTRITGWSRMLSLKAESELPQVQQQLESMQQSAAMETEESVKPAQDADDASDAEPAEPDTADIEPELTEEQKAAQEQQKKTEQQLKQLQGLAKSMELAIKLAPDAEEHSQAAVQSLVAKDAIAATPEQQKTLRILKEIAEPLVKDPQDKNDQQQQDQQQQQNDQNNEDQQQKEDQKSNPSPQDKPEPKDDQQQKKSEEEQQQESQQQQAESILRQARDREREYRELQKERNAILLRGIKVDKDW